MAETHPMDDLLEELLPKAAEVAVAVRDRDAHAIEIALKPLLEPPDLTRLKALIVDLAVMVPDDVPFGELLAWTHGPHVTSEEYEQIVAFDPRPGMKQCIRCLEWWRIEDFNRDSTKAEGRKPRCKHCTAETRRAGLSQEATA